MAARRFPPSWSVEDIEAAFIVRGGDGQRGRAGPQVGRQNAIARRGAPDCGQHRQATRAAWAENRILSQF